MSTSPHQNINGLVSDFRMGKEQAFTEVFSIFYPALCLFARNMVLDADAAEDIVEESFLRVWDKRAIFYEIPVLKTYLYRAVRNNCISWQKKQASDQARQIAYSHSLEGQRTVLENIVEAEFVRELEAALESLPPQRRKIFKLLYKEGKSAREIAEELQISVHTVNDHRKYGLKYLRKLLLTARMIFLF